jgi:glycosyltransferase involved in cell wall biosynthesis
VKILNVHSQLCHYGGAEILLANLTREFISMGHETAVLTTCYDEVVCSNFHPNVKLIQPENPRRASDYGRNALKALRIIPQMLSLRSAYKRICGDYNLTIVHNFPAHWACAFTSGKIIWMCNEPPALYSNADPGPLLKTIILFGRTIDKILVQRNKYICIVSDKFNEKRFKTRYGINPKINNYGVDYTFFSSIPNENARTRWKISPTTILFVHVGLFSPQKNQRDSIIMLKKFREMGNDAVLILAGNNTGSYGDKIRAIINQTGMEEYIRLTGNLPQQDIKSLYYASDYAIFPTKSQGGWLSPFEALATGAHVVITDKFTGADIFQQYHLGFVVKDFIAETPLIAMGQTSIGIGIDERKRWVKEHLSWQRFAECLINITIQ